MSLSHVPFVAFISVVALMTGFIPCFAGEPVIANVGANSPIPIARLVEEATAFDGSIVTIEGEVVGDVMKRGSYAWVCVLDNGTAIGVWAESSSLPEGLLAGGYAFRGDIVRVTGVFHRACQEHGGDLPLGRLDKLYDRDSPGQDGRCLFCGQCSEDPGTIQALRDIVSHRR